MKIQGKKTYRAKRIKGVQPKLPWKVIRKANRVRKRSSLELLVYSWLDKANIKYVKEKGIGRCHVDIFIEPDIILECSGCYFHFCKLCYPEVTNKGTAKRIKDARRYEYFRSRGFNLLEIWEHETKGIEAEKNRKKLIRKLKRLIKKAKEKE